MAPRKEKLSKEAVRDLIAKHKVQFKGIVTPRDWPTQHKHHFEAITEISTVRYDQYKLDGNIATEKRRRYQNRVGHLRSKALELLEDLHVNETTWRHSLEEVVKKPFTKPIRCGLCKGDIWIADREAYPLDRATRTDLGRERNCRKYCICTPYRVIDDNDEDGVVFNFAAEPDISHCPGDNLEHTSLSMKPDLVIGLKCTRKIQSYIGCDQWLKHCPIEGSRRVGYPFLIVEAKREQDAPGFRAISRQTAFPVRRLLRIQEDLRETSGIECNEPIVVWFFAYQGEEWRLYAGTIKNSRVRIYDLWHGTIESQDGALQLLLIVDYIWSWARDIYRPSVLKCLRGPNYISREVSVASTERLRNSLSVAPSIVLRPSAMTNHDLDMVSADQRLSGIDNIHEHIELTEHVIAEAVNDERRSAESSLSFLERACRNRSTSALTTTTTIRHSNSIDFTFRIATTTVPKVTDDPSQVEDFGILYDQSLVIDHDELNEVASAWTAPSLWTDKRFLPPKRPVRVSLIYQTFCRSDWQIEREIVCFMWDSTESTTVEGHDVDFPLASIRTVVQDLQAIRGETSVLTALNHAPAVLCPALSLGVWLGQFQTQWKSFDTLGISQKFADIFGSISSRPNRDFDAHLRFSVLGASLNCSNEGISMAYLPARDLVSTIDSQTQTLDQQFTDAMIAVRPKHWIEDGPKFCLFVLLERGFDDGRVLHQLLRKAIQRRYFFGNEDYQLDETDRKLLREWCSTLASQVSI